MRRLLSLAPAVLLCSLLASSLSAQVPAPPQRQGAWFGAGVGYGAVKLSCGICRDEGGRIGGPSGYLRVGATLSQSFLLGAEMSLWRGKADQVDPAEPTVTRTSVDLFAVAYWYPSLAHGFYLKGGLGLVSWRGGGDQLTTKSIGGVLGVGYEIPVNRQWSIAPFFNYVDSSNGTLRREGADLPYDGSTSMYQMGLGFTYH